METFDEQLVPELDSEVIGFVAASQSFAGRRRQDRAALGLVCRHQGRAVPMAGVFRVRNRVLARVFNELGLVEHRECNG